MVVYYDEDNFSIKLYRDCTKGELVGLIEVIPIEDLLDVWEKHKVEQTEPQTNCTENCHKCKRIRECGYPIVGKCEYEPQMKRSE